MIVLPSGPGLHFHLTDYSTDEVGEDFYELSYSLALLGFFRLRRWIYYDGNPYENRSEQPYWSLYYGDKHESNFEYPGNTLVSVLDRAIEDKPDINPLNAVLIADELRALTQRLDDLTALKFPKLSSFKPRSLRSGSHFSTLSDKELNLIEDRVSP